MCMPLSAIQYNTIQYGERAHFILLLHKISLSVCLCVYKFICISIIYYTYIASLINTICHWIKLVYCLKWKTDARGVEEEQAEEEWGKKRRGKENLFTHNDFIRIFDSPLFDIHHRIHHTKWKEEKKTFRNDTFWGVSQSVSAWMGNIWEWAWAQTRMRTAKCVCT